MQQIILPELEQLRKQTDFIINNKDILENKDIEKYLRDLEKIRYEIFNKKRIRGEGGLACGHVPLDGEHRDCGAFEPTTERRQT